MMRYPIISLPVVLSIGMLLGLGEAYPHSNGPGPFASNPSAGPIVSFRASMQEDDRSGDARLFESVCTICHDVKGITDNPGVYTESAFRDLVIAMVDYGAPIDETEIEVLVGYLTETYGKRE